MLNPYPINRICLGAFQSSPKESLCVKGNGPPLSLRRTKLALQYCLKLKSNPANPAYSCVFQPKFQDAFEGNPKRGPLGIHMKAHFENLGLDTFPVSQVDLPKFAFWDHRCSSAILELAQHKKDSTLPPLSLRRTKLNVWVISKPPSRRNLTHFTHLLAMGTLQTSIIVDLSGLLWHECMPFPQSYQMWVLKP